MTDPARPDPIGPQPQPPPYGAPPVYGQTPYGYPQPVGKRSLAPFVIGIGGAAVVVILICAFSVFTLVHIGSNEKDSARKNVTITHCGSQGAAGQAVGDATLRITNGGTDVAGVSVTVAFASQDGSQQYGTAVASALNLQPEQTVTAHAVGTQPIPGPFVCTINNVSRF